MYYSARSRVKGHLELYHAFVHDEGQRGENEENEEERNRRTAEGEPGWEMLENHHPGVETPAMVSVIYGRWLFVDYGKFSFMRCMLK